VCRVDSVAYCCTDGGDAHCTAIVSADNVANSCPQLHANSVTLCISNGRANHRHANHDANGANGETNSTSNDVTANIVTHSAPTVV
jgi:hypothetical protein